MPGRRRCMLGIRHRSLEALAGGQLSIGSAVATLGVLRRIRTVLNLGRAALARGQPAARSTGARRVIPTITCNLFRLIGESVYFSWQVRGTAPTLLIRIPPLRF